MSFERQVRSKPKRRLVARHVADDKSHSFMSASLGRFALDEFVVVDSRGQTDVRHMERDAPLRRFTSEHRFDCSETDWRQCSFGMHPRQVLVADRTGVAMFDMRAPANVKSMDILTLPHECLSAREHVYAHRVHEKSTMHHVIASNNHVFLVDQRYPNHPVLSWSHLLLSPPNTLQLLHDVRDESGSHDVMFLSSQDKPECHAFEFDLASGDSHPVWIDQPWRVSRPRCG